MTLQEIHKHICFFILHVIVDPTKAIRMYCKVYIVIYIAVTLITIIATQVKMRNMAKRRSGERIAR